MLQLVGRGLAGEERIEKSMARDHKRGKCD
jgi:hypothetical protein